MVDRKQEIVQAAVDLAVELGWRQVTRKLIAQRLGVVSSAVNYYLGSKDALRDAIMEHAVAHGILSVMAEGYIYNHPALANARPSRYKAAKSMAESLGLKVPRWLKVDAAGNIQRSWG